MTESIIRKSDNIGKLMGAIAKFQGTVPNVPKDKVASVKMKTGGTYRFRYADIADILRIIRPHASAQGLAILQPTVITDRGMLRIVTYIGHESGQWIECDYPVSAIEGLSHQDLGAALTYAKRQCLTALTGVAADEDATEEDAKAPQDTGNSEGGASVAVGDHRPAPAPSGPPRSVPVDDRMPDDNHAQAEMAFGKRIAAAQTIPDLEAITRDIRASGLTEGGPERGRLSAVWLTRKAAILAEVNGKAAARIERLPKDMENPEFLEWVKGVFAECEHQDGLASAWSTRVDPLLAGRNDETASAALELFNNRQAAIN